MSQTVSGPALAANPLTQTERTDCRRYCGYPMFGTGTTDDIFYRFTVDYVQLESHMANQTDAEVAVCRSKLTDLGTLDSAIVAASANLDTDKAAVWTHNKNETGDRMALYTSRRIDLCEFLGVPIGPAIRQSTSFRRVI